jgi:hypothetical protein
MIRRFLSFSVLFMVLGCCLRVFKFYLCERAVNSFVVMVGILPIARDVT